jgi:hypothetical protein
MKKCVAEFIGTFALVFAGTVNPSTIRLSGKSEWRGDAIFLRSNVRMLRMKFLAAQSERLPYGHSEAHSCRRPLRHEQDVFKSKDPRKIARSLKHSAEQSNRPLQRG